MSDTTPRPSLTHVLSTTHIVVRHVGLANQLFISLDDCTIRAINLATGASTTLQAHNSPAWSLAARGDLLVSGGASPHPDVILWSLHTSTPIAILPGHTGTVRALHFSPDAQTLASSSTDGTIRIWTRQHETWRCSRVLHEHGQPVHALAWPETRLLSCGNDGAVRAWDAAHDFRLVATLTAGEQPLRYVAAGAGAPGVVVAGDVRSSAVRWWVADQSGGRELDGLEGGVNRVEMMGPAVLATDNAGAVCCWDPEAGGARTLRLQAHGFAVTGLAQLGGTRFATGAAGTDRIKVWDVGTQRLAWESPVQYDAVWGLYAPGADRVVVLGHVDGRAMLDVWDIAF